MSPTKSATPATKRRYDSSRRRRQAEQTRAEVLLAAWRLFNERGWAGTTLAAIAEEAGVAVETIYSGFGSKKALLRGAMDVGVAGDAEPVAYVDRPEFARMGEGTLEERLDHATTFLADSNERTGGVWRAVLDAAEGDDELTAWVLDAESRRRLDIGRSLERIFERPVDEGALDLLWLLYGPEAHRKFVQVRGMSREEYRTLMKAATKRLAGDAS
jgi:AcrR family transcriptional regulator